jgi:nucleoside-diphosphate-sugar epimerase
MMNKVMLSIGHGYSAGALGRALLADGWTVYGTTRSAEKAASLKAQGITPIIWPSTDLAPFIEKASHVLTSVSPTADGDAVLHAHGNDLRNGEFEWVGYLSTTGVYGDHGGAWVDEDTPLTPTTKRGEMRREAEAAWTALGLPLHIFRLAGIYGPNRGPFAKVRAGTARRIIKKGQIFSRIHVDDIAQVLKASINAPRAGAVYNLCDDDPAPPEDVIGYAAQLLGMPMPEAIDYETADMTPMARSFYAENKKVRNDLIKSELGISLKFPDYRIGLETLLAQS